jgi:hypothetical protein
MIKWNGCHLIIQAITLAITTYSKIILSTKNIVFTIWTRDIRPSVLSRFICYYLIVLLFLFEFTAFDALKVQFFLAPRID